jgi:hypothetical protein
MSDDDEPKIAATAQELFLDIIRSRGGAARFTPEQVRLAHALTSVLARKPVDIDPLLAARLADMLPRPLPPPPGETWVPEIVFHDGYAMQLQRAIDASPDDVARTALMEAQHRIVALEAERDGLLAAVEDLQRGQAAGGMSDAPDENKRAGELGGGNGGHSNVVPLRDERHSLAVSKSLDQRYPSGLDPVS